MKKKCIFYGIEESALTRRRSRNFSGNQCILAYLFRACERASHYVIAVRTERIRLIRRLSVFHGEIILSVELGRYVYRARHEAEKGSTCSATEFYISPGERRARDARERVMHTRAWLLTLQPNIKMKIWRPCNIWITMRSVGVGSENICVAFFFFFSRKTLPNFSDLCIWRSSRVSLFAIYFLFLYQRIGEEKNHYSIMINK